MKGLAGLAPIAVLVAALAFAPVAARRICKALYEAAKSEGEITWYVAHYSAETSERTAGVHGEIYPASGSTSCAPPPRSPTSACRRTCAPAVAHCDLFGSTDLGHYAP